MKLSTIFIFLFLIVFPLSNISEDNQDVIDTLRLCDSLNLKLYDIRFTIKYLYDLKLSPSGDFFPYHNTQILGGVNDELLITNYNDMRFWFCIKWYSKEIVRDIIETDNSTNEGTSVTSIHDLRPSSHNSFYMIISIINNYQPGRHNDHVFKLLKVTGPFEVAASIPDFTVHN